MPSGGEKEDGRLDPFLDPNFSLFGAVLSFLCEGLAATLALQLARRHLLGGRYLFANFPGWQTLPWSLLLPPSLQQR